MFTSAGKIKLKRKLKQNYLNNEELSNKYMQTLITFKSMK